MTVDTEDTLDMRFIQPTEPGLVVRQPYNTQPLPAEGAFVEWSSYWTRRLAEGSVVEVEPPDTIAEEMLDEPPEDDQDDAVLETPEEMDG